MNTDEMSTDELVDLSLKLVGKLMDFALADEQHSLDAEAYTQAKEDKKRFFILQGVELQLRHCIK